MYFGIPIQYNSPTEKKNEKKDNLNHATLWHICLSLDNGTIEVN